MAYEFKKLSEVLEVETANSTAKVLIEEEGIIKKVPKDEVGGLKEVDWEIITNKPKIVTSWNDLEDKPFGIKTEIVEIVPEQSVVGDNVENMPNLYMGSLMLSPAPMFIGGNKYTVILNSKTYIVIGTEYSMEEGESASYIGASSPTFEDFPFRIDVNLNDDSLGLSWDKSLGETITFAIYEEQDVVQPLDPKFVGASGTCFIDTNNFGAYTCTRTFEEIVDLYFKGEIHKILPCTQVSVDFGVYEFRNLKGLVPKNASSEVASSKDETTELLITFDEGGNSYSLTMTATECYENVS